MNAAVELAHQLIAAAALARPESGTTVTPSVVQAGTTMNTVPATASALVDVRVRTAAEADRVDAAFMELRPVDPQASLSVEHPVSLPPLERTHRHAGPPESDDVRVDRFSTPDRLEPGAIDRPRHGDATARGCNRQRSRVVARS